jgi:hypothetical protein
MYRIIGRAGYREAIYFFNTVTISFYKKENLVSVVLSVCDCGLILTWWYLLWTSSAVKINKRGKTVCVLQFAVGVHIIFYVCSELFGMRCWLQS